MRRAVRLYAKCLLLDDAFSRAPRQRLSLPVSFSQKDKNNTMYKN